ncbi:MAG TPA: hypothetical protein VFS93_02260 [Terrimesophilobacter sp.]|nr:hypothetical protein [Terrimesophilobacter sp.]
MSQRTQPQVVRSYLGELTVALAGVPAEVAREIIDGVAEELAGLDAAAAASRIEELGDPVFIAAEARAESGPSTEEVVRGGAPQAGDPRWYTVLASLLVSFGGIVVPLLGWVFGIAMVWMSKTWSTWEKWVGTLVAPLAAVATVLIPRWVGASLGPATATGDGVHNVVLPLLVGTWWSGIVLLMLLNVVVGLWLLWRGLRSGR